ncbi:MAG: hypothetical protein WCK51_15770 [Armatimonadota bacterium]
MRRRRQHQPIPSPLLGQHFPPEQAGKAIIEILREIHQDNIELESNHVERFIESAVIRVRSEREKGGSE